jgi:hypothetical protein
MFPRSLVPLLTMLTFLLTGARPFAGQIFEVRKGSVTFHSNAPLELIRASSDKLLGLLDTQKKNYAFRISMSSFRGFNSPLQGEHFNENYVESSKYSDASFSGKIIEDDDLSADGNYTVRAKGTLTIHGIGQERIIRSTVTNKGGKLHIESTFSVLLSDHDIKIPRIVSEKLSAEVFVEVKADLEEKH